MKVLKNFQIVKEVIPVLIVVIPALLIIPVIGVSVNNNAARYMQGASDMMQGKDAGIKGGDIQLRRPLFPLILASGFRIGGKTVQTALITTRIFLALVIILVYLLGRILYSITIGLFSGFLVLSSYGITVIARNIDTDIVLPVFILMFVLSYYLALTKSSRMWAILAGLSMGLALMTKEAALIYLGLPFGILILSPIKKKWDYTKSSIWMLGTLALPLLMGIFYVHIINNSYLPTLKAALSGATYRIPSFVYWAQLFTSDFVKSFNAFYRDYLRIVSPLAFLMIIGWFFVLFKGLKSKKTSDHFLIILGICSLPVALQIGNEGDRLGQLTFFYLVLYMILAVSVVTAIPFLIDTFNKNYDKYKKILFANNWKYHKFTNSFIVLFVMFFLLGAQFDDKNDSTWFVWHHGPYSLKIFAKQPFKAYGRFTNEQQEAAEWLKTQTPQNSKIAADGYTHEALDFFDAARYKIPVFSPARAVSIAQGSLSQREDGLRPLYFITYQNFVSGFQRHRGIIHIFEDDIVNALKSLNPDFLVISGRSLFFASYFDKTGWAFLKFENEQTRIYEIQLENFESISFEHVGVNDSINEHIAWLAELYPDEYELFKDKVEILGLTIEGLKTSPLRFPPGQIY